MWTKKEGGGEPRGGARKRGMRVKLLKFENPTLFVGVCCFCVCRVLGFLKEYISMIFTARVCIVREWKMWHTFYKGSRSWTHHPTNPKIGF